MASKITKNILKYNALFDPCEEGGFTVTVPKMSGLVTEGDTFEKAVENTKDAITGYLHVLEESGEEIPEPDKNTFTAPNVVPVLFGILVLALFLLSSYLAYQNMRLQKQIANLNSTSPSPSSSLSPNPYTEILPSEIQTYLDPEGRYTFKYPMTWKVTNQIPDKFKAKESYVTGNSLENYLSGKMFIGNCRGPILQNTVDDNQIIAFEIVPADGDGGWCWSTGYLYEDARWKVAERYVYPVGGDTLYVPEWKGDYFKYKNVTKNDKFIVASSLVNYETFQLKGNEAFKLVNSSFKFIK